MLLAFVYGVIHSLGPGHAKALFVSHTLTRPTPVRRIVSAAALFSLTHAGVAIVLFLLLRMLLGLGQGDIEVYSQKMFKMSGILVLVAGLLLAVSSYIENMTESSLKSALHGASSLKTIAVFAGLAPCPGAFLILVFTSIIGILPVGLCAVGAVSLGMAATVSAIASAGGLLASRLANEKLKRHHATFGKALRFTGAGAIMTIGALMFFADA
jgi:ABC-type nickel/cobalt efflux system permease component RcnA